MIKRDMYVRLLSSGTSSGSSDAAVLREMYATLGGAMMIELLMCPKEVIKVIT